MGSLLLGSSVAVIFAWLNRVLRQRLTIEAYKVASKGLAFGWNLVWLLIWLML